MHPEVQSSKPRKCPKCGMKLEARKPPGDEQKLSQSAAPAPRTLEVVRQAEEYTCTMHPEVRTTAPGKCPKRGMAIVPLTPAITAELHLRCACSPVRPQL